MDKLTIEHVAPYLPYELTIQTPFGLRQLKGVDAAIDNAFCLVFWNDTKRIISWADDCKLVLRPLSDLTKEIEHKDEKLVPLLGLYKLRTQVTTDKIDRYYIEFDTAVLKFKEINSFNKTIKTYFEVDIDPNMVSFSIVTERYEDGHITGENINMCGNELAMYQFLFKHHFDIFGLIDKGLAIDINIVKEA